MKHLIPILWSLASLPLVAHVDMATLITDLEVGGAAEKAGIILFIVSGDDFAAASPTNPIYMRLRMDHGVVLGENRVNVSDSSEGHDPVHLAMAVEPKDPATLINAAPSAVAVVRWRAGENQIWVRVSQSTSTWVSRGGTLGAPTDDERVFFVVGHTQAESMDRFEDDFFSGLANLAFNTAESGGGVDLPISVDLSASNLQPAPHPPSESLLHISPTFFTGSDVTVVEDLGAIQTGTQQNIFVTDQPIGRAIGFSQSRWINHVTAANGGFATQVIASNPLPGNQSLVLNPFSIDGVALTPVSISVPGTGFFAEDADALFNGEAVSHFQVVGPEPVKVSVGFSGANGSSLVAYLGESNQTYGGWEIYTGGRKLGFDGLAMVNRGSSPAVVTVEFMNFDNEVVHTETVYDGDAFPAGTKRLLVIDDIGASNPGMQLDADVVRFRSTQPLGVIQLRGSSPGANPMIIFPVSPI